MSARSAIESAAIAWLVAAGASGGISSPDAKVIVADQGGPRPPLPYLTVKAIVYDVPVGRDQEFRNDAATPEWRAHGQRAGTLSVNAYGVGAEAWLERATQFLRAPAIKAQLSAVLSGTGINLEPIGGIRNLSGLVDDEIEPRFQRDFAVAYQLESDTEALIELETVDIADTYETEAPPGDRSSTFTITL